MGRLVERLAQEQRSAPRGVRPAQARRRPVGERAGRGLALREPGVDDVGLRVTAEAQQTRTVEEEPLTLEDRLGAETEKDLPGLRRSERRRRGSARARAPRRDSRDASASARRRPMTRDSRSRAARPSPRARTAANGAPGGACPWGAPGRPASSLASSPTSRPRSSIGPRAMSAGRCSAAATSNGCSVNAQFTSAQVPRAEQDEARAEGFGHPDARRPRGHRADDPQRLERATPVGAGKGSDSDPLERPRQRLFDGSPDPAGRAPIGPCRREHHDPPGHRERGREQQPRGAHASSSIPAGGRAQACAAKARWTLKPSRS